MAMSSRPTTPTSANIANGMITPCSMIDPSRLGEEAEAGRSVDGSSCDLGKRPGALRAVRDRLERDPTRGAARLPTLDAAKLIEGVDERIAASASLFHEMESSSRQSSIVHASRAARKYPVCGCRTDGLVCGDRKMCRTGGKTYTVRRRSAPHHFSMSSALRWPGVAARYLSSRDGEGRHIARSRHPAVQRPTRGFLVVGGGAQEHRWLSRKEGHLEPIQPQPETISPGFHVRFLPSPAGEEGFRLRSRRK
jgi:hypothetical protein